MQSFAVRAFLSIGMLAMASVGCAATVQEEALDNEPVTEEAASAVAITPLACEDIELTQIQQKYCGPQTGPTDTSPIYVTCTRDCVTERHWGWDPATMSFHCISGTTTCDPWFCPPC